MKFFTFFLLLATTALAIEATECQKNDDLCERDTDCCSTKCQPVADKGFCIEVAG
ncbi:hypothetical protein FE257_006081 [Aspergillus nanangensis]|uniref:Uncharacterized protein n=1 Tax=Aspergillus nanangensis TaxID=2582783 RepID=A0AAD4GWD5_ASPNN|nr:hypothetical protein FE257_006081 [Aspergillus nanangensis]